MATATIGTGQTYANPAAWEAAIPNNPTEDYTGTCMVAEDYEGLLLMRNGNSNSKITTLDVDSSVRHGFQRATGARQKKTTGDSNAAVHLDTDLVVIKNLNIYATGGTGTRRPLNLAPNTQVVTALTVENCFIDQEGNAAPAINYNNGDANATYTIKGCGISAHDADVVCQLVEKNGPTTIAFQNCSFLADNLSSYVFNSSMGSGTDTLTIDDCKILQSGGAGALFNTSAGGAYSGDNNVISEASAPSGLNVLAGGFGVNQTAANHYTSADANSPNLQIKTSLTKSNYIGSDTQAGVADAEGDLWVAGACDVGCDAESTGAVVAAPQPTNGLRLGLRLGL